MLGQRLIWVLVTMWAGGAGAQTPESLPASQPTTAPASQPMTEIQPEPVTPVEHARPGKVASRAARPAKTPRPVQRERYMSVRSKVFYLGIGLGLGIFAPPDVNVHMEAWKDSLGTTTSQSGFTGMYINMVSRVVATFKPLEVVHLQAVGEFGWGPKIISGDVNKVFNFLRFSPGLLVLGHLPVGRSGESFYAGAGMIYHWMSFEDFSAHKPGFRAELGYKLYNSICMIEVFAAFDYARADTGQPIGYGRDESMVLSYTGVQFGFNSHFGLF